MTKRRIRDSKGVRFNVDMIQTTGNAACAIAYRNALFKGVPKTFWWPMYEMARKFVGGGGEKELVAKRQQVVEWFGKIGVSEKMILKVLGGIKSMSEVGGAELAVLRGIATAINDGQTTVEEAFGNGKPAPATPEVDPTKNEIAFFKKMTGFKKAISELSYYEILKQHGHDHASQFTTAEERASVLLDLTVAEEDHAKVKKAKGSGKPAESLFDDSVREPGE